MATKAQKPAKMAVAWGPVTVPKPQLCSIRTTETNAVRKNPYDNNEKTV